MRKHAVSLLIAVLLFTLIGLAIATWRTPTLVPIRKHWRTVVVVETFQAVNESKPQTDNANESALPIDAYNLKFVTRSTCDSDRTIVDRTPAPLVVHCIKDVVATYTVNRWVVTRVVDITGDWRQQIRYPALIISKGDCLNCEREMQRHAEYYVDFLYNGQVITYQAKDRSEWESIGIEMPYGFDLNGARGIDWNTLHPLDLDGLIR